MANKRIHDFRGFVNESLHEDAGYGEESFFHVKEGDVDHYLFKVELDNDTNRCFAITVGKFAKFAQPTEAKNSYSVTGIVELTEDELDQAVADEGKYEPNDKLIEVDGDVLRSIMDILAKVIDHHLQDDPKVTRIYDEMQITLKADGYNDALKDSAAGWAGEWSFQEVEKGKLNMLSK